MHDIKENLDKNFPISCVAHSERDADSEKKSEVINASSNIPTSNYADDSF